MGRTRPQLSWGQDVVKIKTSQRSLLGIPNGSILSKKKVSKEISSNIPKTSKRTGIEMHPQLEMNNPEINRNRER